LYDLSAHFWALRWFLSFRPAPIPRVFLPPQPHTNSTQCPTQIAIRTPKPFHDLSLYSGPQIIVGDSQEQNHSLQTGFQIKQKELLLFYTQ
jgi:hypothetical protein